MSAVSVDLQIVSPGPFVIGSTITFTATVQPSTSGLMYIWLDDSGTLIQMGTNLSTITQTIEDGSFNRIVVLSIIDGDKVFSGSLHYTVQYTTIAPIPTPAYQHIRRNRSNLELYKWLSYMPKWSFAHNSHLSNYSKLTSYSFQTLTDIASKPIIFNATNTKGAIDTIDYPAQKYLLNLAKEPKQIKTNMGIFENIGLDRYTSFDSYPITNCYLLEESIVDFTYSYNSDTDFVRFTIPKESYLYLTLTDNIESEVVIVGLDKNGKLIKDRAILTPRISTKTINKYKMVIGIYSKVSFDISTLSKSDSYRTGYIDFKRITDRAGSYFEPLFAVDNTDPTIISVKQLNNYDVYKFKLDREIDKFVVTENLDLLFISDKKLYSAKLYFDISTNIGITSSFNNNDICSTQYDDVITGEYIIFTIDTGKIAAIGNHFRIKLENDNTTYWYDKNRSLTTHDTLIDVNTVSDKIVIRKQKLNSNPYIMTVYVENIKEVFQSGIIENIISPYKIADDVYDISIYNGNIYASSLSTASQIALKNNEYQYHSKLVDKDLNIINTTPSDGRVFKVIPIRGCYTTQEEGIVLSQKVNIEEIIYE